MLVVIAVGIVSLTSGKVSAAPTATVVSGELRNGSEIEIVGTGFGERAEPRTQLLDRIVNQEKAYSGIRSGLPVPVGPDKVWTSNDPGNSVVFASESPRHSRTPYYYQTTNFNGKLGWPVVFGGKKPPPNDVLYVSLWIRSEADLSGTGHSSKFVRLWDEQNGYGTRISWTQMHSTVLSNTSTGWLEAVHWGDWRGRVANWNRLEVLVDAGEGRVRAWTNGLLIHDYLGWKKSPLFPELGLTVALLGWDPGGAVPPKVNVSFGEIYADTSPARVELCDRPKWSDCRLKEVQELTEWSDRRVVFKVELGALDSALPVYAYVVDEHNVANEAGVLLSPVRPIPPASVKVE